MCRSALLCCLLPVLAVVSAGCRSGGTVRDGQEPPLAGGKAARDGTFAEDRRPSRVDRDVVQASAGSPKKDPAAADGPALPASPAEKGDARPPAPLPRDAVQPGGMPLPPLTPTPAPGQRGAPSVVGSVLQMPPNQSPIEKALELSARVDALRVEGVRLSERLRALEEEVRTRDQYIKEAAGEVRTATAEMSATRAQLRTWADDLRAQEARLRIQEQAQTEQLRAVLRLLEKAVGPDGAATTPRPTTGYGHP
jgi:hypothetical protein